MKSCRATVMGTNWLFRCFPDAEYRRLRGKDSEAITIKEDRLVDFNQVYLTVGTIRHELLHTYFFTMPVGSANLSAHQVEEVSAAILDERYDEIGRTARSIYQKLKPK